MAHGMFTEAAAKQTTIKSLADGRTFESSPFNNIIVRQDRAVRLNTGDNHVSGKMAGTIVFTDYLLDCLGKMVQEHKGGVHLETFKAAKFNPVEDVPYFRCRYGETVGKAGNAMDNTFAIPHYKRDDQLAGYAFIRADSPFLKITPNSEFVLEDSKGELHKCPGEYPIWAIGTPNRPVMAGKVAQEMVSSLKGVDSLLSATDLPKSPDEARAQFCSDLIPAHVFCDLFNAEDPDSRLFVDDQERLSVHKQG